MGRSCQFNVEDVARSLERELMVGGGVEVADFREAIRGLKAFGVEFYSFLSGGTRPVGFLLSRLLALMVPDYRVHCYISASEELSEREAMKIVDAAKLHSSSSGAHMSWLILVVREASGELADAVRRLEERAMGIILVDCSRRKAYASRGFLAARLLKSLKLKRVFKRAGRRVEAELGRAYSRVYVPALVVNSLISAFLMGSAVIIAASLLRAPGGAWILPAVALSSSLIGAASYLLLQHPSILLTEQGFTVKVGRSRFRGLWRKCRRASVVRFDGSLYVRFYGAQLVDIPVYMAGVDAFALRDLAAMLIERSRRDVVERQVGS